MLSRLDYGNAALAGLLACLVNRLQSILNAEARLVADLRHSDHITDTLASFLRLWSPERIEYQAGGHCLLMSARYCASVPLWYTTIRCWHATRGRLHSLTSGHLNVCQSRLVTVGDARSFITAAPRFWNSLPSDVQSASSLTTFRRKLTAHLFQQSYPDIILQ